jgi:hypothetical protein
MTQRHGGGNLVYILAARTGRPREGLLQIGFANAEPSHSAFDRFFHRQSAEQSNRRDILAAVPKDARHPNQLI